MASAGQVEPPAATSPRMADVARYVVAWSVAALVATLLELQAVLSFAEQRRAMVALTLLGANAVLMGIVMAGCYAAAWLMEHGYGLRERFQRLRDADKPERMAAALGWSVVLLLTTAILLVGLSRVVAGVFAAIATPAWRAPIAVVLCLLCVALAVAVAPGAARIATKRLLRLRPSFVRTIALLLAVALLLGLGLESLVWRNELAAVLSLLERSLLFPVIGLVVGAVVSRSLRLRLGLRGALGLGLFWLLVAGAGATLMKTQRVVRTTIERVGCASRLVAKLVPAESPPPPGDRARIIPPVVVSAKAAPTRHLVLVTVDALRADRAFDSRDGKPLMPHLTSFAQRATRFEAAFTPVPQTIYALGTIITGRYAVGLPWLPFVEGDLRQEAHIQPDPNRTDSLAELLQRAGFATFHATATSYVLNPGTTQGFARIVGLDDVPGWKNGTPRDELLVGAALTQLRSWWRREQRLFAWIHLYDPHHRYLDAEPSFGPSHRDHYDAELRRCDKAFGQLLDGLRALGILEHAAVIVSADHGEEFVEEHGQTGHGHTPYVAGMRIPLLIALPAGAARLIHQPVSGIDITPTALALLGLPLPATLDGRSLAPTVLDGREPPARTIIVAIKPDRSSLSSAYVAVRRRHKLHTDARGVATELYDYVADPRERHNLIDDQPALVAELAGDVASYRAHKP